MKRQTAKWVRKAEEDWETVKGRTFNSNFGEGGGSLAKSQKNFALRADQIRPLVAGRGGCIATDMITVEGRKVGYMYREEPDNDIDSGWRFMTGLESQEYLDDPANLDIYDVNTIANYDLEIIPFLDAPIGSEFARDRCSGKFLAVE